MNCFFNIYIIQTRTMAFSFIHIMKEVYTHTHTEKVTHIKEFYHTEKQKKRNTITFHVKIDIIFTHDKKNTHTQSSWS